MKNYINAATQIWDSPRVLAIAVKAPSGKVTMRVHAVAKDGTLCDPIQIERTNLEEINQLNNYVEIDRLSLREIKDVLKKSWFNIYCLESCTSFGYQRDKNNVITSFMGARCYNAKGCEITKDIFAGLPSCAEYNDNDIKKSVAFLNQYMDGRLKRQIVLAHALSGAVCGMLKKNTILALVGTSSTGKTTIQNLGVSLFTPVSYERTTLKWSATENAIVKRMNEMRGVHVLIDDTQLSHIKNFSRIIYSLENGQSIDRLYRGNEICDRCHWSVSIGITAECSLLDTFTELGAVARMIELPVANNDLFDDEEEVNSVKRFSEENAGFIGSMFVKCLLENYDEKKLKKYVYDTASSHCATLKDGSDHILKRHIYGDVGIIVSTASLANQYLKFQFDVKKLYTALYTLCNDNISTFKGIESKNVTWDTLYHHILKVAEQQCPQNKKDNCIVIPSKLMNDLLDEYAQKKAMSRTAIKKGLEKNGLLVKKGNCYCFNHTINKESVTGYLLRLKPHETDGNC